MLLVHRHDRGLTLGRLRAFVSRARRAVRLRGALSVCLTDDGEIRALNRRYRGQDAATDVLSFPGDSRPPDGVAQAGDLVISLDAAARQARRYGHSLEAEVCVLLLHGLLHLAGMDHERDRGQMRRREIRLRRELQLPLALIERGARRPSRRPAGVAAPRGSAT